MARFWCTGWDSPHRRAVAGTADSGGWQQEMNPSRGDFWRHADEFRETELVRILKAAATTETLDLEWPLRVITHGGEEPGLPIPTLANLYVSPLRGHNFGSFPGAGKSLLLHLQLSADRVPASRDRCIGPEEKDLRGRSILGLTARSNPLGCLFISQPFPEKLT